MAAKITILTAPSSGFTTLVSHAYPTHAHQRTASTSRPLAIPSHDGSFAISCVHWVIARTKTRSKKSSRGVTVSASRMVGFTRGAWVARRSEGTLQSWQGAR